MKGLLFKFAFILAIFASVTLMLASCQAVKFDVDFVVDGEVVATISTSGNETIELPPNPEKSGYEFKGWYWDNDAWQRPFTVNSLLETPISGDMKVYAKLEKIGSSAIDTQPQPNTAYLLFVDQANAGVRCYLDGVESGYHLNATEDISKAVNVYVEESGISGKFYLFCVKNDTRLYINVILDSGQYMLRLNNAPITAYSYDLNKHAVTTTHNGDNMVLGANKNTTYKRIDVRYASDPTFYAGLAVSTNPDAQIPDAKASETNIAGVINGGLGLYKTSGTVVGINAQSFLIKDASGMILVYQGSSWERDVAIGDIVTVEGVSTVYGGAKQFTTTATYTKTGTDTVTHPTPIEPSEADIIAYGEAVNITPHYVKLIGVLSISGPYCNLNFNTSGIMGSITYPIDNLSSLNGKTVEVTAYLTGVINGSATQKYINLMITDIEESDAVIGGDTSITDIADVHEAQVGENVKVAGTVIAKNNKGFLVKDDTGVIMVFLNAYIDNLDIGETVTVEGALSEYSGTKQFTQNAIIVTTGTATVNHGTATELDGAALDALLEAQITPTYVKVSGTLNVSAPYYNLTVEGASTAVGSLAYPNSDVDAFDGKSVEIYGYLVYVNGTKYANIIVCSIEEISDNPNPNPNPNPEPSATELDIAGILAFNGEGKVKTSGVVVAWNAQSFILKDGTGSILVYMGSTWTPDVVVGDKLNIEGSVSVYANAKQLSNDSVYVKIGTEEIEQPNPTVLSAAEIDEYAQASAITPAYVTLEGVLTISGNYYNIAIDGTNVKGSITYPAVDLSYFDGKRIVITGYVTGVSSSKEQKYLNILGHFISEYVEGPIELSISEALAFDGDGAVKVSGLVVAVNQRGFVLRDESGAMTVYLNASHDYAVGDALTVEGVLSTYSGLRQFSASAEITKTGTASVEYPAPAELDGAALDALLGTQITPAYVKLIGTLAVSNGYYNLTVDGASTAIGSLVYPDASVTEFNGKTVEVCGYLMYVNGSKYVNVALTSIKEIASDDPSANPEPSVTELNVAGALAFDGDGAVKVSGLVVAVNQRGFVLRDESGAMTVYLNASHDYAVGDALTVEGVLSTYSGLRQFSASAEITKTGTASVEYPAPAELDGAALDALLGTQITPAYVKLIGTLSVSNGYYNLTVDGASTAIGSLVYPDASVAEFNGKTVEVCGYLMYVNGSKYVNVALTSIKEIASDDPSANPEPSVTELNVAGALAFDGDGAVKVSGLVVAVNQRGFVLRDESGAMTVYLNASHDYAVGDALTVEGVLSTYSGLRQFSASAEITKTGTASVEYPAPAELDGAALDALLGTQITPAYVKLIGTLSVSNGYYNLTVDGASTAIGSLVYPDASVAEFNGKTVEVCGYLMYVNGSKYVNVVVTDISEI